MIMLQFNLRQIVTSVRFMLLLLLSMAILPAAIADTVVKTGRINQIDYAKKTMLVSDYSYRYETYLIVQRNNGKEDQRLPIRSLHEGQWVTVEIEFNQSLGLPKVVRVVIFDNQSSLPQFVGE